MAIFVKVEKRAIIIDKNGNFLSKFSQLSFLKEQLSTLGGKGVAIFSERVDNKKI
jgi:hypothetical protein